VAIEKKVITPEVRWASRSPAKPQTRCAAYP
jgi:hypothetical protein